MKDIMEEVLNALKGNEYGKIAGLNGVTVELLKGC